MASDAGADDIELTSPVSAALPSSPAQPPSSSHSTRGSNVESPAVRQLAAINQKGTKLKSKTSRLRRAFSFSSAAELRKASNPETSTNDGSALVDPANVGGDPNTEGLDEESVRIAQQQEAAGIGSSIYAHAKGFSGSTDNLSISSTASSASIMIRKMGRGLKRGSRSLVGLFRPKSVIGVPAADGPVDEPEASVSMVTAEAERERVNVNADPHTQPGGGTGFPHLELNSIEAPVMTADDIVAASERGGSSGTDTSGPATRKSIVGGDDERAEVLATIRKGILKSEFSARYARTVADLFSESSDSSGGSPRPSDPKAAAAGLPSVPSFTESPNSSAPSTPNEENQGHKRSGSVAISNEDYFVTAIRLRQDSKSAPPGTPQGVMKRSASFSPRIVFYDTWPSQEYDRRGEIATCNRLTPMLAQQIKEELNNFKMVRSD